MPRPIKHINTRVIYKLYERKDLDNTEDYSTFLKVIQEFNITVSEKAVNGEPIKLHNSLGILRIIKKERSGKQTPNWPASNKLKAELLEKGIEIKSKENPNGKEWIVYQKHSLFCMWQLYRGRYNLSTVPNLKYYIFSRVRANRDLLAQKLKNNPLNILKYELY